MPDHCQEFGIETSASEGEMASFRFCNAVGDAVYEKLRLGETVTAALETGDFAGRVWCVETSEAVEAHGFRLISIPGIIAARADQLLAPAL
ncbi:MAG: hypothetical protein KBI47_03300 [Armatimonadetes bacterium]|nr:hypothetical protein [Armatimonadota bacterium]MDI9586976.1 hypothetical protein [Acidobacteriota bacterium]